jgi:hypothetical protein
LLVTGAKVIHMSWFIAITPINTARMIQRYL